LSLTTTLIPLPVPLPPVAQPEANAKLSTAAANRQFFIMIDFSELSPGDPVSWDQPAGELLPHDLHSQIWNLSPTLPEFTSTCLRCRSLATMQEAGHRS
jgi:hypothetical protein